MHRTQIYLQDELYERLKLKSRSLGVSLSELIRRSLEREVERNPAADARAFFDRLTPLQSFVDIEPDTYVRELRSTSRLLRGPADDA
jgi:negative regulator of replication initiation